MFRNLRNPRLCPRTTWSWCARDGTAEVQLPLRVTHHHRAGQCMRNEELKSVTGDSAKRWFRVCSHLKLKLPWRSTLTGTMGLEPVTHYHHWHNVKHIDNEAMCEQRFISWILVLAKLFWPFTPLNNFLSGSSEVRTLILADTQLNVTSEVPSLSISAMVEPVFYGHLVCRRDVTTQKITEAIYNELDWGMLPNFLTGEGPICMYGRR